MLSQRDAVDQWRTHFASAATSSEFSRDIFISISRRFISLTSLHDSGQFDAPFSYSELVAALSKCQESVPGADLHHSMSSRYTSRGGATCFFLSSTSPCSGPSIHPLGNLALWFKRDGDPTSHGSYWPISLASCAFKVFEHMINAPIAPHIFAQLDECQGGFRWGADVMTHSLLNTFRLRKHTDTFVAFVDDPGGSAWADTGSGRPWGSNKRSTVTEDSGEGTRKERRGLACREGGLRWRT